MIKIVGKWYIESDGRQYILQEDTGEVNRRGEKIMKSHSYHMTVNDALRSLMEKRKMATVKNKDMSIQEAIKAFEKIEDDFEDLLRKVKC